MSMSPTRNLFAEFKGNHHIWIETGSFRGDAIQLAIDAGFERIISIDIDPANIDFCKSRFDIHDPAKAVCSGIALFCGDSTEMLPALLAEFVHEPAMFWLDAHAQHLEGEEESENPYPLLDELSIIAQQGISGHTIIIDDMLHLTHSEITGWSRQKIVAAAMMAVGGGKYVGGGYNNFANPVKNSILVAHV